MLRCIGKEPGEAGIIALAQTASMENAMPFHGEAADVIEEQRKQLMQLREENKRLKSTTMPVGDVKEVMAGFESTPGGRTIGMKIPDPMRQRLVSQQERLGGKTYRQIVQTCVELGLRALEGPEDVKRAVREVQGAQRPQGTGLRALPTAV